MAGGGREIERVWVLRAAPAIPADVPVEVWEIEQGYLEPVQAGVALVEEDIARIGFPEGRLRRVATPAGGERFFHTVKSGSGVVRVETEREITRAEFEQAWPRTEGRRLAKTRQRARVGGLVWEIDVFHALPLVMVEVELDDAAQRVEMPEWIARLVEREVSEDARYRNAALAMYGVP
jgi:CYTH domain-containing protein